MRYKGHSQRLLTATLPDGTKITRQTNRPYTHVLVVKDAKGWGHLRWTTRYELAMNEMRYWLRMMAQHPDNPNIKEWVELQVITVDQEPEGDPIDESGLYLTEGERELARVLRSEREAEREQNAQWEAAGQEDPDDPIVNAGPCRHVLGDNGYCAICYHTYQPHEIAKTHLSQTIDEDGFRNGRHPEWCQCARCLGLI